ncbi:HYR domain-containing protein [Zunongwangia sp. F363]|uniref:HYR domain-containing protein n=1 Tax=Autumnicola tepida TaxID=3075595 RepID=A0ABU3CDH9_9FLAO|nr:HYR domain-containing protein [Zunongwangia sp. F363]MDT0644384.1 HYR domain-containing protein [Zunongwangia sp. F363]
MEKNYYCRISAKLFTCLFLLLLSFAGGTNLQAQVRKSFTQRTSSYTPTRKIYNIHGDFAMIGNTNMTLQYYDEDRNNSNNGMVLVDRDNDPRTDNSSRAELKFSSENDANQECSHIVYAGLYWTGRTKNNIDNYNNDDIINTNRQAVKFKIPNGSYQEVTANSSDILFPGDDNMYVAYAEVTDYVRAGGTGDYWVANMALSEGNGGATGYYGGWGMVVIYENSKMDLRDITVFDGYAYVEGNAVRDYEIPISGFNTAQNGDVNMKLGLMAGEGDRGISGDYFQIQKNSDGNWLSLRHDNNSYNNFFNSSIETGASRNPNLVNNTGLDISMFNVPNENNQVIANNQSSTKFRYGSTQDTYVIFNMVMSVDAYAPNIEGVSSVEQINNQSVSTPYSGLPGDEITYKVEIRNKGNEPIENARLVIPVAYNLDYLNNSAEKNIYYSPSPSPNNVTYDPSLGATGSVVWEIGTLPVAENNNTVLADITLSFRITEDCTILKNSSCGDGYNIIFNGNLSGKGQITGIDVNNKDLIQGYRDNGSCDGEPITTPLSVAIDATQYIAEHCGDTPDESVFVYCNRENGIPITDINSAFPQGSRFYNEFPLTSASVEYNINNPFPNVSAEYYAVLPGAQNCYIPFQIEVNSVTSVPETENIEYCLNAEAEPLTARPTNPEYQLYYYSSENAVPQQSITPNTSEAGIFTYYVAEGASNSCISPNKAAITVNVIANPEASVEQQSTCEDPFGVIAVENASAGITYALLNENGSATNYEYQNGYFRNVAPGTYQVEASNIECKPVSASLTIEENEGLPEAPVISVSQQTNCETATGTIAVANIENGLSYILLDAEGEATGISLENGNFNNVAPGTYSVKVSNETCEAISGTVTIEAQPETPAAPVVAEITQPTCAVATGSFTLNTAEGFTYSIDGNNFQLNGTFNGLAAGTYSVIAKNEDGCISEATSVTIETQPETPAAPVVAETVQPTCALATGSFTLNTAEGFTYSIDGNNFQSNGTFNGLAAGTYSVTAKNEDGCISEATSVTIEAQPETPAAPVVAETTQPTCDLATGTFTVNTAEGFTYSIDGNTFQSNGTFSGLIAGTYSVIAKNEDGCISEATSVIIEAQPETPAAPVVAETTQPTCDVATGAFTLNTAEGFTYSIDGNNFQSNGTFSGLAAGTYSVIAKNEDGCVSEATSVTIEAQPKTPAAPVVAETVQPTCSVATGSFSINISEGFTYSIDGNNFQNNGTFSGLAAGTYSVIAKNEDGCISEATSVIIESQPETPAAPVVAEITQPTCAVATGSFTLNTAEGFTYSIDGNSFQSNGTFSGLAAGTYTVIAKNEDGCVSEAISVTIESQPETPAAPVVAEITQPTCAVATGSLSLNAVAGFTYSIDGNSFQANGTFNGLTAGTYTVIAKNEDGCISETTVVTIEAQPETPAAPVVAEITQPTCTVATGSFSINTAEGLSYSIDGNNFQLAGNFSGLAAGTYSVIAKNEDGCISEATSVTIEAQPETPAAPVVAEIIQPTCNLATGSFSINTAEGSTYSIDGNNFQSNATFSGLAAGTYSVIAKNEDGCISETTVVTIEAQPETPAAPVIAEVTQPTCDIATGAFSINTVEGFTYSIDGNNFQSNGTFSGFAAGTYSVIAKNEDGCTSEATSVTIESQPETPAAPVVAETVQPTCDLATGAFTLNTTEGFTYSIDGNNFQSNGTFSGLAAGTYSVIAKNEDGCISEATSVTIENQPETPAAPVVAETVQPTCDLATGAFTVNTVEGFTYSIDGQNFQSNGTFSGLAAGTYTITAKNEDGCISEATSVTIEAQPETPAAPVVAETTQPTCDVATGAFTLNTTEGFTYSIDGNNFQSNGTFSGLAAGTYSVIAKNEDGCISEATSVTIESQPETPAAPVVAETVQPTCALATGSFTLNTAEGFTYSIDGNNFQSNGTFSGLAAGTYSIIAKNVDGCISEATAITIEAQPETPAAPVVGEIVQPTCELATGAFSINTVEGFTYSIDGNNFQSNATFSGLIGGTYSVIAKNEDGCTSEATSVTIEAQPETPAAPVVAEITQPTCAVATGSFSINTVEGFTYSIDGNNFQSNATFSGLIAGTYTITAKNEDGCVSEATSVTIESQPETPAQPEIISISSTLCGKSNGELQIAIENGLTYTLANSEEEFTHSNGIFAALPSGTYQLTVSNGDGDCQEVVNITIPSEDDNIDPTIITCAPDMVEIAADNGSCEASNIDLGLPTATDNCTAEAELIVTNDAPEVFEKGQTIVTWTVTDAAGNFATCTQTVNVIDTQAPEIEEMDDIIVSTDENICGATVSYETPSATDNCEIESVTLTEGLASGEEFPTGTTTVTYTATDNNGNTATTTFTVTVEDNEDPVIACQDNIIVSTEENESFAVVDFEDATATDNCSVTVEQTAGPASGSQFPVGTTTITYTATDGSGNTAQCSFTVTVEDEEAPELTCPSDIAENADADICGAVVTFETPQAIDNGGNVSVEQIAGPVSGEVFPVGVTTVTFTVTDEAGNTAVCSFTVTITDDQAPVIEEMDDIVVDTDENICGAIVSYETPSATDNCGIDSIELTEGLASGEEFPTGTTTVTYTATDNNGNTATTTFTVTVEDNEDPVIVCQDNIIVSTEEGQSYAVVDFEDATANDNCSVTVEQTAGPASGSQFPVGTTTITYTATDGAGNTAECSFTITVEDEEAPELTCPSDIAENADADICGAVVTFETPQAIDNGGNVSVEQTEGPASGEVFPVGTTTVTFTVTDEAGNTAVCSFSVTITDDQAPVIEEMDDILVSTDENICGAIVSYETPSATDNCEIDSIELTEGLASGEEFPTGTTTITYTATDNSGNNATTSFTVTVEDNEDPVIVCQDNIIVSTEENESYAIVDFEDATATDNCSVTVEQTAGPASGSQFPVGTTTITYTATDGAGNTAECSFTVTVEDEEAPELTCPSDISQSADADICGAVVEFETPSAVDNGGSVSVEQTAGPASGEVFPVGVTTVTFTVTDEAGNTAVCSFTVTITDDQAPVIEEMDNIVVPTDENSCGAIVNYESPSATDNCEIENVTLTEGLASGEEFPTGTTTVTYTATDNNGNTATTTFSVTVEDNEDPVIACQDNIIVSTEENESYAIVDFEDATATDNCSVTVEQTAGPASGSQFPVGTTTITYTATDGSGNTAECSFTVTVEDEEAPELTCPSDIAENADADICGAVVTFETPEAVDNGGSVSVEQTAGPASGEVFPVGVTTVTFTVTDEAGNTAVCSFSVTITDDQAPVIEKMENIIVSTDENSCGAIVNYESPSATDNCGIDSIELTEGLASGEEFPTGTTTVTYTATDNAGNTATTTFTVTVEDNEDPVIVCQDNITVSTEENESYAIVDFEDATATDNCSVTVEQTAGPASGSQFPVGTTTITYTATDGSGNTAQCSFTVTVEDEEVPELTCPSDIEQSADADICGAVVEFEMPSAVDNGGTVSVEQTAGPASGEIFPVGVTTVEFTVTDEAGNTAVCSFTVTITDDQAPEIEEMDDIVVDTDADNCGAIVNYEAPSATDNCGIESIELTEGLAPGSEFPTGTTTVTYTATDNNGNTATTTFTVTVEDNEAPVIVCQDNITVSTEENESFAVVDFEDATATDNCEVTVEQTAGPASGSQFPVGTTTITYTATDGAGNTAQCSFTVTVEDEEAPELTCPSDIEQSADADICGAVVTFQTPQAVDNGGTVSVEQTAGPASGEIFPVGVTTVEFTVTDEAGNTAVCSFSVTITDDQAPVIEEMDDIVVSTDENSCGAIVSYETPSATDNCGIESIELTEGLASGEEFPTGRTTVTYTATDNAGNTATTTFSVTVEDNEDPVIVCQNNIIVSTEENESFAVVDFEDATATDNCSVTVEQTAGPASGSQFPAGTTIITYTATDGSGNTAQCSFTVTVEEEPDTTPPAPEAPIVTTIEATCAEPGIILVDVVEGLTYSIDGENYQTSGTFNEVAPGTYNVTARDEFGQISEATTVNIAEPVAAVIETTTVDLCIEDSMFDLFELLLGDYDPSGTWIDTENTGALDQGIIDPAQLQVGSYTFEYQTEGDCSSTTEVTVSINDDCVVLPCSIGDVRNSITKAVTPNNDGINDTFSIDFANECGFVYDVKIFNRWGAKVYEAKDYQNNWDGFATNSFTSSNQLPAGTYFYILEIRNSEFEPIQGYIYLGTK